MALDPTTAAAYNQDGHTADAVQGEEGNRRQSQLELDRAQEAADAGVKDARFIGYAEVLEVYNRRSDTEPLADRRARELATDAGQQSFTRAADWTGDHAATQTEYPADGGWTEVDHSPAPDPEPTP